MVQFGWFQGIIELKSTSTSMIKFNRPSAKIYSVPTRG